MNTNGTHQSGLKTMIAAKPITQRFLFVSFTDDARIAAASNSKDIAIGISTDTCSGPTDPINVSILNANTATLRVVAGATLKPGDLLSNDEIGRAVNVRSLPTGSHRVHGIALSHANAGEILEFTPTLGSQTTNK